MSAPTRGVARVRSRGFTLVDVMVALAIAMATIVLAYRTFVALHDIGRTTVAAADAQATAAYALAAITLRTGNAGTGIRAAARWFEQCAVDTNVGRTLRPIAAIIVDGGGVDRSDALVIRQSLATIAVPLRIVADTPAGAPLHVEAVDGVAVGERIAVAGGAGRCAVTDITAIRPVSAGIVELEHSSLTVDIPANSIVISLGPATRESTLRFDVDAGTLRSTDVANGDAPSPVVSNVWMMKGLYGLDNDGDGIVDDWVDASPASSWTAPDVLGASPAALAKIVALRIGVIARTDRTDDRVTRSTPFVLFDCEQDDKTRCPGRIAGTVAPTSAGGYRYRALETIVPLRNAVWTR